MKTLIKTFLLVSALLLSGCGEKGEGAIGSISEESVQNETIEVTE